MFSLEFSLNKKNNCPNNQMKMNKIIGLFRKNPSDIPNAVLIDPNISIAYLIYIMK